MPKMLYKDCMDEETIDTRGLEPVQKLIDEVGGWFGNNNTWYEVIPALMKQGFSANEFIFLVEVDDDDEEVDKRVMILDQPMLGIAREYFIDQQHEYQESYKKYMIDTAILFGLDEVSAERFMSHVSSKSVVKMRIY
jgi:predicted metalloendopeptidase